MPTSKESDLTTAVLLYAVRCLDEGDQLALRAMQFGPKEVDALQQLNITDLCRTGTFRGHCLQVQLDREVFWHLVARLRQQRESDHLQLTLMQADAPQDMMRALFGLGSKEYARWRRLLGFTAAVGRPSEPDEEPAHTLWLAWQARAGDDGEVSLTAEDYLALKDATGLELRTIWCLTQRWTAYGNPEGESADDH